MKPVWPKADGSRAGPAEHPGERGELPAKPPPLLETGCVVGGRQLDLFRSQELPHSEIRHRQSENASGGAEEAGVARDAIEKPRVSIIGPSREDGGNVIRIEPSLGQKALLGHRLGRAACQGYSASRVGSRFHP